jgi:hypothetical protein
VSDILSARHPFGHPRNTRVPREIDRSEISDSTDVAWTVVSVQRHRKRNEGSGTVNDRSFDGLARFAARTAPRRAAVGLTLAAATAFGLADQVPALIETAAARRRKRRCPPYRQCPTGCCPASQICLRGVCYKSCKNDAGSCAVGGICGAGSSCFCIRSPYGWGVCVLPTSPCDSAPICTDDSDCLVGELCLTHSCCATTQRHCWRQCDT